MADYIWNRLYHEGAQGFTFVEALDAAEQQCLFEIRMSKDDPDDIKCATDYRLAINSVRQDYERIVEAAKQQAESRLVEELLKSSNSEIVRLGEILQEGNYEAMAF